MRLSSRAAVFLSMALAAALAARAGASREPGGVVQAGRSQGSIRLDGLLDEPAWREAGVIEDLTQQSPRPGEPTLFRTTVRILVIGDTLYFGFDCRDPEPAGIAVHTMQRDKEMEGDDTVALVVGTYGDGRTGYGFKINAAGARADALLADAEHASFDWDGIWDARTARTPEGWSAEIEIPLRTLSFAPGLKAWGLNLERVVARERLVLRWTSPTLDSFLTDLSRAGTLSGLEDLKQGRGLEFSPFLTGRTKEVFRETGRAWQGAGGFDFTWRITPQMAAVFTANTDFAETEVDSRQINLTRFPLFFPEKRTFFLEGSNLFEFGLSLGHSFIPFFTRRVGLLEGRQAPINAGVKMSGRAGKWNLAILDVQTRGTSFAPAVNLFAGRASYDVDQHLRVGALVTAGDPSGKTQNTLVGFDAIWRTSTFRGNKNFQTGGWAAFSTRNLSKGRRTGWGYKADYPNDFLDCYQSTDEFGDALNPAMGYLPRPGVRLYQGGCSIKPRPARTGSLSWIRQAWFRNYYTRVTNLRGVNESWRYSSVPLRLEFESGDQIEAGVEPQYEMLPAVFEIVPGIRIPPGAYRFDRWSLKGQTSSHRPAAAALGVSSGSFYSGRLTQWTAATAWTSPKGRVQVELSAENNFGRLKEGSFAQRLWQERVTYAWSPNLVLSSFIQYDSESRNLGANTRLRWTIKPGREFFVVWNRGWQRLLLRPDLNLIPDNELLAVKLRWTFRM